MKIGDEVYIHGFVDEIRKDTVIIRNKGGYFGTDAEEVAPTVERKKGKWIIHPEVKNIYGGIYIECSKCHTKYVVQHIEDEKYCRNCGAEMEQC